MGVTESGLDSVTGSRGRPRHMKFGLIPFFLPRGMEKYWTLGSGCLGLLLLSSCVAGSCPWIAESPELVRSFVPEFQKGGLKVVLRHTKTGGPVDRKDCLYPNEGLDGNEGRKQAELIGKGFSSLSKADLQIYFSPYCRTAQTAEIAFPNSSKTKKDELVYGNESNPWLKEQIQRPSKTGVNEVYVTHGPNMNEIKEDDIRVLGFDARLYWGIAAFFSPSANREPLGLLGCSLPDHWAGIVSQAKDAGLLP